MPLNKTDTLEIMTICLGVSIIGSLRSISSMNSCKFKPSVISGVSLSFQNVANLYAVSMSPFLVLPPNPSGGGDQTSFATSSLSSCSNAKTSLAYAASCILIDMHGLPIVDEPKSSIRH